MHEIQEFLKDIMYQVSSYNSVDCELINKLFNYNWWIICSRKKLNCQQNFGANDLHAGSMTHQSIYGSLQTNFNSSFFGLEKLWKRSKKLQFSDRHLQNSDTEDYACTKF